MNSDKISKLLGELSDALTREYGDKETLISVDVQCSDVSTSSRRQYIYVVSAYASQTETFHHSINGARHE